MYTCTYWEILEGEEVSQGGYPKVFQFSVYDPVACFYLQNILILEL